MIIDKEFMENIQLYIKVQNIQLLKYISYNEGWDYKELVTIINKLH
jgi:hypothetical protein